jgi:hypothetical protein
VEDTPCRIAEDREFTSVSSRFRSSLLIVVGSKGIEASFKYLAAIGVCDRKNTAYPVQQQVRRLGLDRGQS